MPPKPKPAAASKKTEQKKKEKVIEDKTFGLKNKKGAKQQKFIQQVEKQIKSGGVPARKLAATDPKKDKNDKADKQKEMALLFKPVQKVEKGADPKSVVCAFFKQGQCTKGAKCKFSHDLTIERKAEKRSIYVDMRDDDDEQGSQPREILEKEEGGNRPTTDIVCKFFLDAVENNKYGWFWACPNGDNCKYRHALPKGYVLKKDRKKDKKEEISLEDLIEKERAALASIKFTKITLESFLEWKKRKIREKAESAKKEEDKKRRDYKAGLSSGLSGREMFSFNPELASGDMMEDGDEAFNSYQMNEEEEAENYQYREIQLDRLGLEASEVISDGITEAPVDRLSHHVENLIHEAQKDEEGAAVVFNENLFVEDGLDEICNELEECSLSSDSESDDEEGSNFRHGS